MRRACLSRCLSVSVSGFGFKPALCRFSHRLGGMDPLSLTTITKPRTTKPEESAFRLSDGTKTCLIVIVAYYCALDMQFSRDYTQLKSLSEGLLVTHLRVWQVFGGFSFPFHSPARTDRDRVSLTRRRRRQMGLGCRRKKRVRSSSPTSLAIPIRIRGSIHIYIMSKLEVRRGVKGKNMR